MKYNKKDLRKRCNDILHNKNDANTSEMYKDVELKMRSTKKW